VFQNIDKPHKRRRGKVKVKLSIPWINVTQYSAVAKCAQSPQFPGRRDSADVPELKLRCNKRSASTERPTPSMSSRRPHSKHVHV
jgi:hypothetical protein